MYQQISQRISIDHCTDQLAKTAGKSKKGVLITHLLQRQLTAIALRLIWKGAFMLE